MMYFENLVTICIILELFTKTTLTNIFLMIVVRHDSFHITFWYYFWTKDRFLEHDLSFTQVKIPKWKERSNENLRQVM